MTRLLIQGKNDFGHESTPQTDSLRDSSINHALIAIAQEVTELLRQTYPIQTDEIKTGETK
ncbi:hypothetical protein [Phormidium tenue]|uniref:Uncharacterized protein n=1 Tax=Phormidium tenue NIES-30 TaxID=549789 RepID=A0A1U7IXV0_9CYAN|nr:hypothetical protein [Phormidium tenue]MBD2234959.1 hypothetical protein [Phormidium tenue FACHB-1052]OKH43196.1 hypothetical protein NIES30_25395 [Phormidium tenue NIES-30]